MPITETGYRSHFSDAKLLEEEGGPLEFVLAWLHHGAKTPAWRAANAKRRFSLFA